MQDKPTRPEQQSPADIAREAFRRLAARRIAPTPDAYRDIYDEITGTHKLSPAEKILADLAANLSRGSGEVATLSHRFSDSLKERDWETYGRLLHHLTTKHLLPPVVAERAASPAKAAEPAATKTGSMPLVDALVDDIAPAPEKKPSIPLVDEPVQAPARTEAISLVDDVEAPQQLLDAATPPQDGQLTRMLREMLVRTLSLAVTALLQGAPALTKEAEELASAIHSARSKQALTEIEGRLKLFCFRV
ncbi:MAG TPA: hypothetical protein VM571_13195 [Noviherbaspirillum sp.]|nr:hypothetical protein [Noviherbaspirillum sp.]